MIELKSAEQLNKAIERARAGRLFVQPTSIFRQYRVTNRETGARYIVNFFVRNGKRYGHCTCLAGQKNLACKHIATSAAVNIAVAQVYAAGLHNYWRARDEKENHSSRRLHCHTTE